MCIMVVVRVKIFLRRFIMDSNFLEVEGLMREFYDSKSIKIPKHFNRILALVMLDAKYGIDNLHAIKRVYNRIRHCRQSMFITSMQAIEILEDTYTYTPDFNCIPLEYTIDDDTDYSIGTLDAIQAKKYAIELSANIIADKIREETLTKNLFLSMPETRYLSLKITVATLLSFYDRELNGEKLDKDTKKAKKSRQEKIRTYLFRWYGLKPKVNYDYCIAYYESMQKFENGYYTE